MAADRGWRPPPTEVPLSIEQAHVWRASLDLPDSSVQSLRRTLAQDEIARAERFRFERHRRAFIVARGRLRAILGRYLGVAPDELRFCYNAYGKPSLVARGDEVPLRFNLSHSGGLALYAVTGGREVGIDLEQIRAVRELEGMIKCTFSARERAALLALPADRRTEAFFACWTRKEAYVKAKGQGLSVALDQFDVPVRPDESARLLRTHADPQEAGRWRLQDLAPGLGYVAALAVEGHDWQLACWDWRE